MSRDLIWHCSRQMWVVARDVEALYYRGTKIFALLVQKYLLY
jgi:hypothetical protein